jgi:outer membrane protein assembly complex protein YaeT
VKTCALFAAALSLLAGPAAAQEPANESTVVTATASQSGGTAVRIGRPIEVDPEERSVCKKDLPNGRITLSLEGLRWDDWNEMCDRLIGFLRPSTSSVAVSLAKDSERLLADTGYFGAVVCTATASRGELTCAMSPQPVVADVEVDGDLPWLLLEDDLRRQVFLRPGTLLGDERRTLDKQAERIVAFLERDGYFGSTAKVELHAQDDDAPPNDSVRVHAEVEPGKAVNLGKVDIKGPPDLPREEIEETLRHYWFLEVWARRFTPNQFDDDLEEITRMLQKNGWPEAYVVGHYEVDLASDSVNVTLEVQTGPKVIVQFKGNRELDHDDLMEKVTFEEAGSADVVEIEKTVEAIKEEYQEEGYFQVEVTSDVEYRDTAAGAASDVNQRGSGSQKIVTFFVKEGPRAEVENIRLVGNKAFTEEQILDETELKTKTNGFLRTGRWIDERIDRDEYAIRRFYRLNGYAVARVKAERKMIDQEKMEIVFHVQEGPLRKVDKVDVEGMPEGIDVAEMKKRMRLIENAPYVEGRLVSDRREILTTLASAGYPEAVVNRRLKVPYKTEPGNAEIVYRIEPGRRSTFGGFLVRGNFRTAESVIEHELDLEPGEPLDLVALSEAKQRLRSLGVFSSVDLKPLNQWANTSETWLLVELAERDQLALDLVGSFATDDLFSIGADFRDPNFLGRAINFDISARLANASEVGIPAARIGNQDFLRLRLQAPHPLGLPFNADYSAFYSFQDSPTFVQRTMGITAGINRVLLAETACKACPQVTARLGYELISSEGTYKDPLQEGDPRSFSDRVPFARIVPGLRVSRLDSPVDPRSGYAADLRLELAHRILAGPINGADFWRAITGMQGYLKLGTPFREDLTETLRFGGPVVLAAAADYGVAHPWAKTESLPNSESFYYGGDTSVRGMRRRASQQGFPDANYMFTGTLELRWYFLQGSFGALQIAALSDYGTVSYDMGELFKEETISVGGAIRYVTPVGPLSVAYAVPVMKPDAIPDEDAPDSGTLHIAFGYSF